MAPATEVASCQAAGLSARKPAIVYSDGIGDTVMSLPALRGIVGHLAHRPTLVANPVSLSLVEAEGFAGQFLERPCDPLRLVPALRGCDMLITLDPDQDAAYSRSLLRELRPPWSIGWSPDHAIVLPKMRDFHFIDEAFQVARAFGSESLDRHSDPPSLAVSQAMFGQEIYSLVPSGTRVVVVHAETGHRKMWPDEQFGQCLAGFLADNSAWMCLVVGLNCARLETGVTSDRVIDCTGLSLGRSMSLIGLADLFVGIDSGMLHVADSFRVPSVGIFGPTDPVRWGFRFADGRAVVAPGGDLRNLRSEVVRVAMQAVLSTLSHGVRRHGESLGRPRGAPSRR